MWKNNILREEADENVLAGSGSDNVYGKPAFVEKPEDEEEVRDDLSEDLSKGEPENNDEQANEPKISSKATVSLDPETIAQLRANMAPANPQQSQPAKEFTREQIQQKLMERINPVRVNAETLEKLGFVDPTDDQVKAFQTVIDQTNSQAVNTAKILLEMQESKFKKELTPIQDYYQRAQEAEYERQAKETEATFYQNYSALDKYKPVVQAVASRISDKDAQGKPKSVEAIFKEVADNTVLALREMGIEVENVQQPARGTVQSAQPSAGQVPRMASATRPGRSQGPSNNQNNPDADIYGKSASAR